MAFTPEDLKKLVTDSVTHANTPIIDSVKDLAGRVSAVEQKAREPIIQQPPPSANLEEHRATHTMTIPKDLPTRGLPADQFSIVRFAQAQITGRWDNAKYEREVLDYCQKTLTWASGSGGGLWVAPEFLGNEFVEMLRAQSVCRQAGCTVWQVNGAAVQIPRMTGGATFYWVAQDSAITPSDQTPNQATLSPKQCVGLTRVSQIQASLNPQLTERIVRDDLAKGCTLAVDTALLLGSGSSNQPTGVIADSSRNTFAIGTNGGTPTIDNYYAMLYECEVDNVPDDNYVWFMHPRQWDSLRKIKVNGEAANFALQPDPTIGTRKSLFGYPVYTTTVIPINLTKGTSSDCSHLFLVRIKDLVLAEWGGIDIRASDVGGNAWNNNLIEIKVTYVMDTVLRYSQSACTCSDARG